MIISSPRYARDVRDAVAADVPPIELRYTALYGVSSRSPFAYLTTTRVYSHLLGVLDPQTLVDVADTPEAVELARRAARDALDALAAFDEAGRHVSFIAVRAPVAWLTCGTLYDDLKRLFGERDLSHDRLCLAFPPAVTVSVDPRVRQSLLDARLLSVRTMITGCGSDETALPSLMRLPFTEALLTAGTTALTQDRDHPGVFDALVGYLHSLEVAVYAEGATSDDVIRACQRAECAGYVPAPDYRGVTEHFAPDVPLTDAIAHKEVSD
ncbi:MAG: EAL domain-containing protein [Clostridia bacterium]|nr:EAL domain-containing protein [Clostridia bacterium]